MKALERKLVRDLWAMRAQIATIAMVVASGVGAFSASLFTHDSLLVSRDLYYASSRFADVFAYARRAPESVRAKIATLADVREVQTALVFNAQISLEGVAQPLSGRMIGLEPRAMDEGLNRLSLRAGRWPAPGTDEVVVNEAFAGGRGLAPGSEVRALLNGRSERLRIVGVALSPEYIYATTDAFLSDDRSFGVFWMHRERLEAAFDMRGAFNYLALQARAGAIHEGVISEVDRILAPFGSRGAFARKDQPSHMVLTGEIQQQRVWGTVLPTIFLAVAAFVLNVVLSRQVTTQRDQIAALKALGYPELRIATHFLAMSAVIVMLGVAVGLGLGQWLGRVMTQMYTDFFHLPEFVFRSPAWVMFAASGACLAAGLAASWLAVRRVTRLSPAQAMRPPTPADYHPILLDRVGLGALAAPPARMILRSVERRPLRALMTVAGIASAVAILVSGTWFRAAIDRMIEVQFEVARPGDYYLGFTEPRGPEVLSELARLPGVLRAEAARSIPARLHAGHRQYRVALQGIDADAQLSAVVDEYVRVAPVPAGGMLLTDRLAAVLEVAPGDVVRVEFLDGERREREVRVWGVVRELMGMNAYLDAGELRRLAGEAPLVNSAALATDGHLAQQLYEQIKRTPGVAGVFLKEALVRYTRETSTQSVIFFTTVLTLFAAAIAVGVVYNNARIALAERAWELATLRVLGMTHREVGTLLLGELGAELAIAIPLGLVGGYYLAAMLVTLMSTHTFRIPLVILPPTYAYAALTVIAAGALSGWLVQRRLRALDLIAVLKTRE